MELELNFLNLKFMCEENITRFNNTRIHFYIITSKHIIQKHIKTYF